MYVMGTNEKEQETKIHFLFPTDNFYISLYPLHPLHPPPPTPNNYVLSFSPMNE